MSLQEEKLLSERQSLIRKIADIDVERKSIKAEIIKRNRMSGARKLEVSQLQHQEKHLYQTRCTLIDELGRVNSVIKDIRLIDNQSSVPSNSFAQNFVLVAKGLLKEDVFDTVAEQAAMKSKIGDEPHEMAWSPTTDLQTQKSDNVVRRFLNRFKGSF